MLARYLDTEGTGAINARVIDLVCEAREAVINAHHSRGAFQAGCIFTGQPGRPKLNVPQEQLQFLIERRFNTTQIASILGVSPRTIERRLREHNLNISTSYSNLSDQDLDTIIKSVLTDFPSDRLQADDWVFKGKRAYYSTRSHSSSNEENKS